MPRDQSRALARRVKRLIDVVGAGGGLLVLSPLLAVVATAVRAKLGRPVLFSQTRSGLDGRLFRIYKFRSMTDARDATGTLLPDEARMTSFGRFLRSSSLDELPELFNVVKGDMSLVGPRPLLPEYLDRYSERQRRRHEVPPGITGWCQIKGRNALAWEDKLELDVWYVDHWSMGLDLRILASTVLAVLTRKGIAPEGHVTMPNFQGASQQVMGDAAVPTPGVLGDRARGPHVLPPRRHRVGAPAALRGRMALLRARLGRHP